MLGHARRSWDVLRDAGRCQDMPGDVGRCQEMLGLAERCWEMLGHARRRPSRRQRRRQAASGWLCPPSPALASPKVPQRCQST